MMSLILEAQLDSGESMLRRISPIMPQTGASRRPRSEELPGSGTAGAARHRDPGCLGGAQAIMRDALSCLGKDEH